MQVMQFKPRSDRRRDPAGPADVRAAGATIHPIAVQAVVHALRDAAEMAGFAPSVLDSRPWQWRPAGDTMTLHLDRARVDRDADADGRLAVISCGAALHHARITLAAAGWRLTIDRRPDPADPDRLASLRLEERSVGEPAAAPLADSILLRRTGRTPVTPAPLAAAQLKAITSAVRAEETSLHVLYPDEVLDLARVASGGRPAPAGTGERSASAESAGLGDGRGATFALLYGHTDEPEDWLRAGEALSAAWLTATAAGVSVLPLSAAVEMAATRQAVQIMIGCVGYPYLLLRLGHAVVPPPGPRRAPLAQVADRP